MRPRFRLLVGLVLAVKGWTPLWQLRFPQTSRVEFSQNIDSSPPLWNVSRVNEWLQNPQQLKPPATPGALLHIGKSGGSTLSQFLRNACHSWVKKPCNPNVPNETRISLLTTYYHTPDFDKLHKQQYQFYTVTLRDPLDRTRSSFSSFHMANYLARKQAGFPDARVNMKERKEFSDCFPNFEDFVTVLGHVYSPATPAKFPSEQCRNLTYALWEHDKFYADHFYWDTRHIHQVLEYSNIWDSKTDDRPILLALRTEHLWKDWVSSNHILGQEDVVVPNRPSKGRDYSQLHLPLQLNVTLAGQRMLCEALRREYEAYFSFLRHARNLLDEDRQASLAESRQNCPWLDLSLDYQAA